MGAGVFGHGGGVAWMGELEQTFVTDGA
jgi:hypothetical protein